MSEKKGLKERQDEPDEIDRFIEEHPDLFSDVEDEDKRVIIAHLMIKYGEGLY